jgi:hypothetical protein
VAGFAVLGGQRRIRDRNVHVYIRVVKRLASSGHVRGRQLRKGRVRKSSIGIHRRASGRFKLVANLTIVTQNRRGMRIRKIRNRGGGRSRKMFVSLMTRNAGVDRSADMSGLGNGKLVRRPTI